MTEKRSRASASPGKYTPHQKLFYISLSEEEWQEVRKAFKVRKMSMSRFVTEKLREKKRDLVAAESATPVEVAGK